MFQYYKRSRHFVFSAFIAFVFVLLCQNTAFARASSNGDLPTKADLQAQLDSLNKQKDLSAQDKLVQQDLTDTLATLDKIDRVKEETVRCASWKLALPRRWTICKTHKMIWRLITASWFRYRRSPNAYKMRCITLRSSCNKFAVVWMGLMSARQPYVPARLC